MQVVVIMIEDILVFCLDCPHSPLHYHSSSPNMIYFKYNFLAIFSLICKKILAQRISSCFFVVNKPCDDFKSKAWLLVMTSWLISTTIELHSLRDDKSQQINSSPPKLNSCSANCQQMWCIMCIITCILDQCLVN